MIDFLKNFLDPYSLSEVREFESKHFGPQTMYNI